MFSVAKKIIRSFGHAFHGVRYAYRNDESFRLEVWGGPFFIFAGFLLWPLSFAEFLFLTLSYILILITELSNTALETAFKRLHPEHHELVGASKDISSSAVLFAFVFAGTVVATLILERIL